MLNSVGVWKVQDYPIERRKGRRFNLNWVVQVKGTDPGGASFEEITTLRDLSSSGAYAYVSVCPQVGTKLSVSIKLPVEKKNWMTYSATVVRVEKTESGAGIAFKFETSRPEFASMQG
jgi:hypothetical protein